ncbi:hypothetical protein CYMTET_42989, partial [Cymbomonas tetramitiformis]
TPQSFHNIFAGQQGARSTSSMQNAVRTVFPLGVLLALLSVGSSFENPEPASSRVTAANPHLLASSPGASRVASRKPLQTVVYEGYVHVGSFTVSSSSAPQYIATSSDTGVDTVAEEDRIPTYSCVEACKKVFGAPSYAYGGSTSSTTVTRTCYGDLLKGDCNSGEKVSSALPRSPNLSPGCLPAPHHSSQQSFPTTCGQFSAGPSRRGRVRPKCKGCSAVHTSARREPGCPAPRALGSGSITTLSPRNFLVAPRSGVPRSPSVAP